MEADMEDTVAREGRFSRADMYCTVVGRWRVPGLDCTHTRDQAAQEVDCGLGPPGSKQG